MPRKQQTAIPGVGFLYAPKYRDRSGKLQSSKVWWMEFRTTDGAVRRSTGRRDQVEAFNELLKVGGKRATGEIVDSSPERVRVGQLLDDLLASYDERATLHDLKSKVERHLRPAFGDMRAAEVRKTDLLAFVAKMKRGGWIDGHGKKQKPLTNASINRLLAALHRAFALGAKADPPLVLRIPDFPLQDERGNVRQGVLSPETYRALRDALPPHARLVLVLGYHTGMRRGEILGLRWDQIDLEAGTITLRWNETKNRTPRVAPIYGEMRRFLEAAMAERDPKHADCEWVVNIDGKRVFDIKTAWASALRRLSITERVLVHDLRRTALIRMEDAGIPRHVAMQISGHKTEAVYRRYLIGNAKQAVAAGQKLEAFMAVKQAPGSTEATI